MTQSHRRYRLVPRLAVDAYPAGQAAQSVQPADFILTHGSGWFDGLIRFGQALRYRGPDRKYTRWNHAALIVNDAGDIIEADGGGVARANLSKYTSTEYYLVRVQASPEDRAEVVKFAEASVGGGYGTLTIVSIALTLATGAKFNFGVDGQQICSGLVARAEERTGVIFVDGTTGGPEDLREPSHMMPADLAKYYGVEPPT